MNIRHVAVPILLSLLIGGGVGYGLSSARPVLAVSHAAEQKHSGIFNAEPSFSEIESSREFLSSECYRIIAELRSQWVPALRSLPTEDRQIAGNARRGAHPINVIAELKEKIEEFRGTEQEFQLLQELLTCLRFERRYGEWLELYLRIAYENPTQPLVGWWAERAMAFGRAVGRERELLEAFQHLTAIPRDFQAKHEVQEALARLKTSGDELVFRLPPTPNEHAR
jgi:hypothetical protein